MPQQPPPAHVLILAAGIGRRLGGHGDRPKVLLEFGGRSLLHRHLDALEACGVRDVSITVGHASAQIEAEVERLGRSDRVRFVHNPRFREGSLVSLAAQSAQLRAGEAVLLMDGDVLYEPRMLERLVHAPGENILLVDREIEPGDEPVKICFREDRIVDFRKRPEHAHDWHGESVGFFRFSARMAASLADRCAAHLADGGAGLEYEEAIRDLILASPDRFAACDVSDLPWIEIDFEADIHRARSHVLPQLEDAG